jgi:hypothetical protein
LTETRLIMGTTTSSEKNTQSAVDHSSGFHIFEFHLPTAGLGAGVFIFVLLILVLLYYCRKNFSKRRPQSFQPEPMVQYQLPRYPMMAPPQAPFPLHCHSQEVAIKSDNFAGLPVLERAPASKSFLLKTPLQWRPFRQKIQNKNKNNGEKSKFFVLVLSPISLFLPASQDAGNRVGLAYHLGVIC